MLVKARKSPPARDIRPNVPSIGIDAIPCRVDGEAASVDLPPQPAPASPRLRASHLLRDLLRDLLRYLLRDNGNQPRHPHSSTHTRARGRNADILSRAALSGQLKKKREGKQGGDE